MDSYEIIMTPDAADDLVTLRDYISGTLLSPDTALAYIRMLRMEIGTLSVMPERHKCVDDEPWRSREVRRIIKKNFIVYYRIDKTVRRVYILNVIYAKHDQLQILAQISID